MKCERRRENGVYEDNGPLNLPTEDHWRADGTCSYCGSLNPDDFMKMAIDGVELGPTDKNYKVYVGGSGRGKFYFQHLSIEQMQQFVNLYNAKVLKIGYPGHFYRSPFFMRPAPAPEPTE